MAQKCEVSSKMCQLKHIASS
ncbi:uncharacterized protein G2W53_019771 [Senna tora]|uniref:Uncharacterized protein n=1 Tax=Senna tora TaxID=362788 RepID=A0A834WMP1_9FABA|nr:uncharacterized protein G2W53_019771 [Senna tora]